MKNLFISDLNKKDIDHFTSDIGLFLRRKADRAFKKLMHIFMHIHIIQIVDNANLSDEEYFSRLELQPVSRSLYPLSEKKNVINVVLERYPALNRNESYIFVGNHTAPEDIELILSVIDRNAYLVLGSVETIKYNKEAYLSWLNGMIVFDILNQEERKDLIPKMERVLKTNSILIFPEGSHNYHPNKLINHLFDGPVNLALRTGKRIVPVTLLRNEENNVYYIDVGNPIDVSALSLNIREYYPGEAENEKYRIKALSCYLRDKMATALYHQMARHTEVKKRSDYEDIEKEYIDGYEKEIFTKLKWKHDVFDAEYMTKKNKADREYEEVVRTLSCLRLKKKILLQTMLRNREYILKELNLQKNDVISNLRGYFKNEHSI